MIASDKVNINFMSEEMITRRYTSSGKGLVLDSA